MGRLRSFRQHWPRSESKGIKTQASCGQCPQGLGRRGPAFCVAWHQPHSPASTGKWPTVDIKAPEYPCLSFCSISRAQQCVHFKIMITMLFGKIQRLEFMSKYSRTKHPKRTQLCAMAGTEGGESSLGILKGTWALAPPRGWTCYNWKN